MPTTTSKNGRVKGEGRVISINAKYGFLAAQGINSKVFIIPSSLKMEAPFPSLTDELHIDDLVTFEANEQAERNGAKYLAVDGSVKLKQRGKDVMVEGEGKIVRLDLVRGCFGFIDSGKVGSVFFNIAAVRPSTTDVGKVLKMGQKVRFRALPNSEQPNCKWRASLVCASNKANEYLNISTNNASISTNNITNNGATSSLSTPSLHNFPSSSLNNSLNNVSTAALSSPTNNNKNNQQTTKMKNKNLDSNRQRSKHITIKKSSINNNNRHTVIISNNNNNRSGSVDTHQKSSSSSAKSRNFRLSSENLKTTTTPPPAETPPPPSRRHTVVEKIGENFGELNVNGGCVDSSKNFSTIVKQSIVESETGQNVGGGAWPFFGQSKVDPDCPLNPAKMWDLYLEQQQKALNENFYNPFGDGESSSTSANLTQIRRYSAGGGDVDDLSQRFLFYSNPFLNDSQVGEGGEENRDSICRHIKSLVHGWPPAAVNEKCDYCRD
uniref:Uncharacterized protein n=1 Tax=Romanomermis culicivorax TaxID=13658 RepID=A0A915J5A6_ROMCU